jgi:hypothetical protein
MPGDDFPVFGNQHRIGESEAFDRRGDLLNLGLAVTPRVARVRPKRSDRYVLDRGTEFSHAKAPKSRDCRFFKICASGTTETDRCEIADQVGGMLTAVAAAGGCAITPHDHRAASGCRSSCRAITCSNISQYVFIARCHNMLLIQTCYCC